MDIDPIEHAWTCCNPDTDLPTELTKRPGGASPLALSLSSVGASLRVVISIDEARRAAHSRVIGKRVGAFSLKRTAQVCREEGVGF